MEPKAIHICDGSEEERTLLFQKMQVLLHNEILN